MNDETSATSLMHDARRAFYASFYHLNDFSRTCTLPLHQHDSLLETCGSTASEATQVTLAYSDLH